MTAAAVRVGALLTALLLAALALLAGAAPAAAHADLVGTSPRAGQVSDAAPHEVTVRFDDPVDLGTAQIRVLEPDGSAVPDVGAPSHPKGDQTAIAATLPAGLRDGARTVFYRVATQDGHPVQGSFVFGIGVGGSTAAPDTMEAGGGPLGLLYGIARWFAFVGLAMFVGTAFFVGVCWPEGLRRPRARALFWGGGATLGAATATSLLLYTPYVSGGTLAGALDLAAVRSTLDTRVGGLLAARLAILAVLALVALAVLRRAADLDEPEPALAGIVAAGVLVGGGALAATWSLATHSAVGPGLTIALPVDVAHLLAMSVWLGGLPVLLAVLLPSRDAITLERAVPVFSRIALICVASLVLTGTYQAWRAVGSPSALTGTTYGGVLLAKVAAVAVVVSLGAKARTWTGSHARVTRAVGTGRRPRPAGPYEAAVGPFRRVVAAESAIAVVILGLTASLVSLQPARSAHAADVARAATGAQQVAVPVADAVEVTLPLALTGKGKATKGWVAAEVSPAAGGLPNELHVSVLDAKGAPLAVEHVFVALQVRESTAHSQRYPLTPSGRAGHYVAPFNVPRPDKFSLGLTVHGKDGKSGTVLVPVDAH